MWFFIYNIQVRPLSRPFKMRQLAFHEDVIVTPDWCNVLIKLNEKTNERSDPMQVSWVTANAAKWPVISRQLHPTVALIVISVSNWLVSVINKLTHEQLAMNLKEEEKAFSRQNRATWKATNPHTQHAHKKKASAVASFMCNQVEQ